MVPDIDKLIKLIMLSTSSNDGEAGAADSSDGAAPIPIKHVVVIIKEGHTFDNYFGAFPGAAGAVGVISPLSHDYCERCNRVRLGGTADLADGGNVVDVNA